MKRVGVVIAGHGDLASALLSAAELIMGPQSDVAPVCLEPQDSPETYSTALRAALAQVDSGDGVIVLADLFGGTPANVAALGLAERAYAVLSGVNLPMILEVLASRNDLPLRELAAAAIQAGRAGIIDVGARVQSQKGAAEFS